MVKKMLEETEEQRQIRLGQNRERTTVETKGKKSRSKLW
jgi:hypothetical protein